MMKLFALIVVLIANFSCVSVKVLDSQRFFTNASDKRTREDYCAQSNKGMVASAHHLASEIGSMILARGGNAVDAAVATSFAISVLRPQSTGIGGGGFLLLYKPHNKVLAYDFRERAPKKATAQMYLTDNGHIKNVIYEGHIIKDPSVNGHLAVGTPGLVAGLLKVHEEHGSMPLIELIKPSIKIAKNGFSVYSDLAQACKERQDILENFADSRRLFVPKGVPLQKGEWLVQDDLAWTLEQIAKNGVAGFYEGPVAIKLIAEIKAGKGILSQEDLSNYRVKMRDPVETFYRGFRVVSMPPPSSGGVHIMEMLNILSYFDLRSMGHASPQVLHILAETMKRAFADRARYLGDPDFVKVPVNKLLSKEHAAKLAQGISRTKATPAEEIRKAVLKKESASTTHISVVDKNGIAVSTTQTINYSFGSGVVARGTGIVLNDEMDDFSIKPHSPNVYGLVGTKANSIAANKTMLSSMSPTLVFDKNNELEMVVGSPGGPKIINATLQTIVNVIDFRMSLPDAVHSFRIHHQWLPDVINIEPGALSHAQAQSLMAMGHTLKEMKNIGDVQAIQVTKRNPQCELIGVSDTRSNGKPF